MFRSNLKGIMLPRLLTTIHYNGTTFGEAVLRSFPSNLANYNTRRVLFDCVIICIYFGKAQSSEKGHPEIELNMEAQLPSHDVHGDF